MSSDPETPYQTGLDQSAVHMMMRRKWELKDLPEPGETWRVSETDLDQGTMRTLIGTPIIKTVEPYHDGTQRRARYRTNERYYEVLQRYLENTEALLPCGHSSIQNPRDIDGIRCGICESEFTKEEVRQ